jgi:uncharacterized protein
MQLEEALDLLRARRAELDALGVRRLSLFGSLARGEAKADSDVDVLVEFTDKPTFDAYMDLKFYLEKLFSRPVDLATPASLRPQLKERIEREAVHVA